MKVKCPDCTEAFDLSVNEYDEGDALECPECKTELTVVVKRGKLGVIGEREKYYSEELDDLEEEEE